MQIHRFMQHPKASCLDLQFILSEAASQAKDIQKTIVFVNLIAEIFPMIDIIQSWMKLMKYPVPAYNGLSSWIKPYFSTMSEYNKEMTANKFGVPIGKNTACTILVATDAYGMGIDNPDVLLVIQWDLPLFFDTMIQRMGRAGRKGGASAFVLLTPKWTMIKDPLEIKQRIESRLQRSSTGAGAVAASLLSASMNRPMAAGISPLSQIVSANKDVKSVAKSEASGAEYDDKDGVIIDILTTVADENSTEH
ncbi:hypothetical protein MMC07_009834 [Pseudocyphellaria aurata]|nr:hypothetical protein [Pseudocyphellaria aurata]